MKRVATLIMVIAALTILTQGAMGQGDPVPKTFNYQGRLIDGSSLVNGQKTLAFRMYDAPEADTNMWAGIDVYYAQTSTVMVVDGLFSVAVGTQPNPMWGGEYPLEFLSQGAMMGSNYWLEVAVDGVILGPREPLQSAPYALVAGTVLDRSITAEKIDNDAVGQYHIAEDAIRHEHIGGGQVRFEHIWFNYATNGQVMKFNGSNWIAADDETSGPGGSGTSDHGSLDGLTDPDDHPQYLLSGGSDTHTSGTLSISAASTLDVNGTLRMDGTVTKATTDKVVNLNADQLDGLDSPQFLRSDVSDTFASGKLTVNGELELGATTLLDANGSVHAEYLYIGPDSATDDDTIYFDAAAAEWLMWDESEGEFALSDDLDVDGNLNASGNVGIGTSTPAGRLNVVGDEVRIGSGQPNYALGDGDLYVADFLEVDGDARLWAQLYVSTINGQSHGVSFVDDYGKTGLNVNVAGRLVTVREDMELGTAGTASADGSRTIAFHNDSRKNPTWYAGTLDGSADFFISLEDDGGPDSAIYIKPDSSGRPSVGIGMDDPRNMLHVVDDAEGHVCAIENENDGSVSSVLLLTMGVSTPTTDNNFITFRGRSSAVGAVEGNASGGVVYKSGGADFAEYLPRADPREVFEPGDIVALSDGKLFRDHQDAQRYLVVSDQACLSGNWPGEVKADAYSQVAIVGQVDARVRGPVSAGDYVVAVGDSCGIAVARHQLTAEQIGNLVGQAWESSPSAGERCVRVAVGIDQSAALQAVVGNQQRCLDQQSALLRDVLDRLERMEGASAK